MKRQDKIYAVIDTNVLVSNFFSGKGKSNPSIIIDKVVEGTIIPIVNQEILNEYQNVLSRPHFKFPLDAVTILYEVFRQTGIVVEDQYIVSNEEFPDPKDIVFYEVRMAVDDSYLVTGNIKHFPQKPFVVTPAQMVEILKEKGLL